MAFTGLKVLRIRRKKKTSLELFVEASRMQRADFRDQAFASPNEKTRKKIIPISTLDRNPM